MNINDFRYMRQGKQLRNLSTKDIRFVKAVNDRGPSHQNVLLALHGFASSPAAFRFILPKIKPHYDAVVCPVLAGHGESIVAFSQVKAQDWLDQTRTLCLDLAKEYEQVDVLGLSLGGLLACELSKTIPLHHLFLLAPALKLNTNIFWMSRIAGFFLSLGFVHLRNMAGNLLNYKHAEISYRKLPLATAIEIMQLVAEFQWQPPSCPFDLFLGGQDQVINSKAVEKLFSPLHNARIHWLKDSAHVLSLDNDVNEIIDCINLLPKK